MKRILAIFLVLIVLSACSAPAEEYIQIEAPAPETTFFRESSADHQDPRWTEEELLTAFYQYAEIGTEIVDCVVIPDSAYGIVGVVQYTEEEDEGCWFDFLNASGKPESVGTLTEPAGKDTLTYIGKDTVTCTLLREDGSEYTCTIAYFASPAENTTGFKVTE